MLQKKLALACRFVGWWSDLKSRYVCDDGNFQLSTAIIDRLRVLGMMKIASTVDDGTGVSCHRKENGRIIFRDETEHITIRPQLLAKWAIQIL